MAAPIERFLHAIVSPRADDTLGSLIDRIITDDDYDISMARTLADAIYNTYSSKFISADDLMKVLIAIPSNECALSAWHCIPIFASNWGVKYGTFRGASALIFTHNADRSKWNTFTRGTCKVTCTDGTGTLTLHPYNAPTVTAATFKANQTESTVGNVAEYLKTTAGIRWFAETTKPDNMISLEIHPTAATVMHADDGDVTLVEFDKGNGNSFDGDSDTITLPGYVIDAILNMPVQQRAELLQYLIHMDDGKAKPFTFEGIVRRALQRRIDTTTIDGLYKAVRGLKLKPDEKI